MSWETIKKAALTGEDIVVNNNDYRSMLQSMQAANETYLFDFVTIRDLLKIGLVGGLFGVQVWRKSGVEDKWFRRYLICA